MPTPPFNFSTLVATSAFKLLGVNIAQVPVFVTGAPPSNFQYGWMFQNFSSGQNTWTNWIQPQIKDGKDAGANHVRPILGGDAVLDGRITNAQHNAAINTILADARSRGMTVGLSLMAVGQYSLIGSPSAAAIWEVAKSVLDNCIVPNQDVVAYFEPCNQESFGADITVNNAINALMKAAGYVCPIGASNVPTVNGADFSVNTSIDLGLYHNYPQVAGFAADWPGAMNGTYTAIASKNIPIMVEEFGYHDATGVYGAKADWIETLFYATFNHPAIVGGNYWAAYGGPSSTDGNDWSLKECPGSYSANAYNPATVWGNTTASNLFRSWGIGNRKAMYPVTVNGAQAISGTQTVINLNGTTPIQSKAITNQTFGVKFWSSTKTTCIGVISLTGDAGATYRVSYGADYFLTTGWAEIGHVDIVGPVSNRAINISGTFSPGDLAIELRVQRIAGPAVDGSLTVANVTIIYGNGLASPASSLIRGDLKPSHLLLGAAAAGLLRNPVLTRRRSLNPLLWR